MFKKPQWLKNYGIWLKVFLAINLFIWIGGFDFFISLGHDAPSYEQRLDEYSRPPKYTGQKFEDWKSRVDSVRPKIERILESARQKGKDYSVYDYFIDYNALLDMEDKYRLYLTGASMMEPIHKLVLLRDQQASWKRNVPNEKEQAFIAQVKVRIDKRTAAYEYSEAPTWESILRWLITLYLKLAIFWLLIYLLRFGERKISLRKFKQHHHEGGYFYDDEEPFPGTLSLADELLICPQRFIGRVLLWPFYCMHYPHYESPAQMFRFMKLKAYYLKFKPFGYQLSDREEQILNSQTKEPIRNFDKAIKQLLDFETGTLVKRSLATAYLSLFLGIYLQPVIVLAAKYSDKANDHFYGQSQIVLSIQAKEHIQENNTGPPDDFNGQDFNLAILSAKDDWDVHLPIVWLKVLSQKGRLKQVIAKIEPVPRISGLMRSLIFQPITDF